MSIDHFITLLRSQKDVAESRHKVFDGSGSEV